MKKAVAFFAASVLAVSSLAACGDNSSDRSSSGTAESGEAGESGYQTTYGGQTV